MTYPFIVYLNIIKYLSFVKNEKIGYIYTIKGKNMIIIPVKNYKLIEQALKSYKLKIYKTKQNKSKNYKKEKNIKNPQLYEEIKLKGLSIIKRIIQQIDYLNIFYNPKFNFLSLYKL